MRTPNNSAEMCEVLLNFKGAYDSGRGEQSDSPGQRGARSSQFNVFFFFHLMFRMKEFGFRGRNQECRYVHHNS